MFAFMKTMSAAHLNIAADLKKRITLSGPKIVAGYYIFTLILLYLTYLFDTA